ncbi:alpha/beta fold hydrolase [Kribbella sp. NPDC056951]|uniref:alpha/beta fold hydrolase n=1 Tax=Kribbella sp. NPDC056951 TaxID=3345978 RepID=UPI0036363686
MSPVVGFAAVIKGLAADHRVVAYDRAGYGGSDAAPLSVELQLQDLVAVLEAAGPGPRVVVGHSWGGLLAQLAAWDRPDLVDGLVLLDPSHEAFWTPAPELPGDEVRRAELLANANEQAQTTARAAETAPEIERLLVDACLSYVETAEQQAVQLAEVPMILEHLGELAERRTKAVWPEIPVRLLTATKGRPEFMTTRVLALLDELPGTNTVVPDSGHYLHLDRPDLVIAAVREVAG